MDGEGLVQTGGAVAHRWELGEMRRDSSITEAVMVVVGQMVLIMCKGDDCFDG